MSASRCVFFHLSYGYLETHQSWKKLAHNYRHGGPANRWHSLMPYRGCSCYWLVVNKLLPFSIRRTFLWRPINPLHEFLSLRGGSRFSGVAGASLPHLGPGSFQGHTVNSFFDLSFDLTFHWADAKCAGFKHYFQLPFLLSSFGAPCLTDGVRSNY